MAEHLNTAALASSILSRKKKKVNEENILPVNTKLRSFDLRQQVESAYQDALANFTKALKPMPEYQVWEAARKQWTDLFNKEHARIRNEALEAYTKACHELPEWQSYFAALKRRYEVVNCGMMS